MSTASNLVNRGPTTGISETPGGRKCYSFSDCFCLFSFVCFDCVPNQKFSLLHIAKLCYVLLKMSYKTDGMFHTNRFIMDTLILPEL